MNNSVFNIVDFGAIGDGVTKNTNAIQTTLDKCEESGGGIVFIPAGKFLIGTIFLKSNINLHLSAGAELIGSPDIDDYNQDDCFPQNQAFTQENVTGSHLIIALELKNISITGLGTINGNNPAFFENYAEYGRCLAIKKKRPGQMLCFYECENVRVEGISLLDSTYWNLFLHGCENVIIRGLHISNLPTTQNGDGIDIDCCRNVVVSDCIISSGDDSITLRANSAPLKDTTKTCENITVTNCILSTPCNAIRIGVGNSTVKNCIFSNIVINKSECGICIISRYPGINSGVKIKNIRFDNIIMETNLPLYINTGENNKTAGIENIYIRNVNGSGSKGITIAGNAKNMLKNISLSNVELEFSGGKQVIAVTPEEQEKIRHEWDKCYPFAFFICNVMDIELENVKIKWANTDGPWQEAIHCVNVVRPVFEHCSLNPPPVT